MRFDRDNDQGKYSFYLDPLIPYVVGANAARPVDEVLARHGLRRGDIDHWIVHTGGKKVIDGLKYNLDPQRPRPETHSIGAARPRQRAERVLPLLL